MSTRCPGCMKMKTQSPICEHCGYNENVPNYTHQLPVGTVLRGQYTVGKVLGQGGFGITYIGWDDALEAPVAIKEYYPNSFVTRECTVSNALSCTSREMEELFRHNRKRFLREARMLARLQDVPGIVRVHNLFQENNTAYIVMEYVEGIDLKRYIRALGRTLTVEETLAVLRPVMDALSLVHDAELVHRDISPDNIMIRPDGSAKLLDFGAAREVENADVEKNLSQSTESILKHGFAPIEQYQRRGNLGPWTDVYALCATVYYCLTGKVPADAPERMIEQAEVNWNAIPGLSPKQAEVFARGMALLPKDRIRSIRELYQSLRDSAAVNQTQQKPVEPKPVKPSPTQEKEVSGVMETNRRGGSPTLPKAANTEQKKKKPIALIAAAALALVAAVGLFARKPDNAVSLPEPSPAATSAVEFAAAPSPSPRFLPEADPAECLLTELPYVHTDRKTYFTYFTEHQDGDMVVESANLRITVSDNKDVTITLGGLDLKDSYQVNKGSFEYQTEYQWEINLFGNSTARILTCYRTQEPIGVEKEIPVSEMSTIYYAKRSDDTFDWTGVHPKVEFTSESITWRFTIPDKYESPTGSTLPKPFDFTTLKQISVHIQEDLNAEEYCICYNPPSVEGSAAPAQRTYTQIAAGLDHTVVLFSDGTVEAIGSNEYGQCDVENWQDIVQISALKDFTLGLKADGTMVATGHDYNGQCNVGYVENALAVSAGARHTLYLTKDGHVWAVFNNDGAGECGTGDWENVIAIDAAYSNSIALCEDGTVYVSGSYSKGKIPGWSNITAISASDAHFLGLRSDGTVMAAGSNNHDQCDVDTWRDIIAVGAGCGYSVGLRSDGTVLVQGLNDNGQHEARSWKDIVYISVGLDHIIGVKSDGTFVATGDNEHGECSVEKFNP